MLSSSKVKVLKDELNLIQQKHDDLESKLTQRDATISSDEKEINSLRNLLESTLIELELSQFEIELLEEQL